MGLRWDLKKDKLVVSCRTKYVDNKNVTQRLVLSLVSKVFDPIGLVAPFTVTARLLLTDIWKLSSQNWEKVLPDQMIERFSSWCSDLPKLGNIRIASVFPGDFDSTKLQVFRDSSQEVFSAVAFLRAIVNSVIPTAHTKVPLILGKQELHP